MPTAAAQAAHGPVVSAKKSPFLSGLIEAVLKKKSQVTAKELVIFSRQFSTLVGAGVPIVQGLTILGKQAKSPAFREVLQAVRQDIESGLSISEAIGKHPQAFPPLYISMVKAGELGGILDTILERLSAYLESAEALKSKVKSALMYPLVVLGICACVTVFLMVFVIPTFKTIFGEMGAKLPLITELLLGASDLMKKYILVIAVVPVGAYHGAIAFYAAPCGRRWVDARLLALPVVGLLMTKVAVARFTRTLATLVKSGVPILQALDTVAATAGNVVVTEAVLSTRAWISEGGRMSEPLAQSGIFPDMVVSMIAVGEETGALDVMLAKIADFYDQEVDADVKGLTSMIEPLVMVLMGFIVGTIVIAMFLPMFNMPNLV